MREIVPILFEVQGHVMKQYGFIPDDDGELEAVGDVVLFTGIGVHAQGSRASASSCRRSRATRRLPSSPRA